MIQREPQTDVVDDQPSAGADIGAAEGVRGTQREAAEGAAPATGMVIAMMAGTYPLPSETFVYREVAALRERGWGVRTVSLHAPEDEPAAVTGREESAPLVVYGSGRWGTLKAAVMELLTRPWRTACTLMTAMGDALAPGEATRVGQRVKLPAQAVFGVGLARRLRRERVTHIHCHFAHAPTSVGMYAARQLGVPMSFTGHANDIFERRVLLRRKLERAAFVSCISHWHRAFYQRICARHTRSYPVVRCGVGVDEWQPPAPTSTSASGARPGGPGVVRVITVCRLVEKKGVDTLIRAMGRLTAAAPGRWRLTIVGDGPMRDELERLAREIGCADAIGWAGAVENRYVRDLLTQSDMFALPCRTDRNQDRDGIPVVLMEAMACGLPAVAGDLEAIRELIEHEHTGLLVDGADDEEVAGALGRLAASKDLRRQLGEAGRRRVQEEFSQSVNIDRLMVAIRRVAGVESRTR